MHFAWQGPGHWLPEVQTGIHTCMQVRSHLYARLFLHANALTPAGDRCSSFTVFVARS
jgi:hypothetical protein